LRRAAGTAHRAVYGQRVGDAHLDALEHFLTTAPVLHALTHTMGGGGHPSFVGILEGGVGVLLKPEDAPTANAPVMIRREVAAWRLARALGWQEMVAATVLREVVSLGSGALVRASAQVLWPNNDVGVEDFLEEDFWRAAVFDALIRASDRHGSNWLAVPAEPGEAPRRLKLIDHGHAFDLGRGINEHVSPFYVSRRFSRIPDEYVEPLVECRERLDFIFELLPDAEAAAFTDRLEFLAAQGILDIGEP
jgi:hypothetical protein